MGQVMMATDHGGQRVEWTTDTGSPIGKQLLELPMEDRRRVRDGNLVSGAEQVIGNTSGSASMVQTMPCLSAV